MGACRRYRRFEKVCTLLKFLVHSIEIQRCTIYIGIDPGLTGGIVALYEDGSLAQLDSFDDKNPLEVIKNFLSRKKICSITLESVHAMPGQGVSSMFNFGRSYGAIIGLVYGLGYNLHLVSPQSWQKIIPEIDMFESPKESIKRAIMAEGLEKAMTLKRSMHQGVCDAYFIAKYSWLNKPSEDSVIPKSPVTPVSFKKTKRKTAMKI